MSYPLDMRGIASRSGGLSTAISRVEVEPEPSDLIAGYYFNDGDTMVEDIDGVSWDGATNTIDSPAGETETGVRFRFTGSSNPEQDASFERRWTMPELEEFAIKVRFFVPENYFHRTALKLSVAGDISAWQVGDTVTSANDLGGSGEVLFISGSDVFLLFATNSIYSSVWTGNITNSTRGTTRASTRIGNHPSNNKFMALWCDKYSSSDGDGTTPPQGPRLTFETDSALDGGSALRGLWSPTGGTVGVDNRVTASVDLITPDDIGTWIDWIVHVVMASPANNDGQIRTYVKREGESSYTLMHEVTNADITPTEVSGFKPFSAGYLWGAANSGFTETTDIHVSEFELFSGLPEGII